MQSFEIGSHFHPYKITLIQELHIMKLADLDRWFLNEENYYFSKYILFSDECTFHNGNINRHNLHAASAYPSQTIGKQLGGYSQRPHH